MTETKQILLVEDETLIVMSEAMMLRREGYGVALATSGEEAIAKVESAPEEIALILMEIDLGKNRMDGTEAAQEILKKHDIPILFLSSHAEPDVVEKTEKITSYGYVVKGSSITVLAASIKMAFKLHAAHRALRQTNDNLGYEITERKQVEDELRKSKEQYQWLIENAPDVVYTFSTRRGGIYYSPRVEQVLGYSPEYLLEHPFFWNQSIHPDDQARISNIIHDFESGKPFEVEYRIRDVHGNWLWLNDRSIGRRVASDEVLIEGLAADITGRKRAEEALHQSEARFRSIVHSSPVPMGMNDANLNITLINPAFTKAYGYTLEDLPTVNDWWLKAYPDPEYREKVSRLWLKHLEQAQLQGFFEPLEADICCKDGSIRTVLSTAETMGRDGETIVINYDITDRVLTAKTLQKSEEKLKQVLEILPVGVWIADKDGKIVQGNSTGQQIWAGARYVGPDEFYEYKGWWLPSRTPIAADEWGIARATRKGETSREEEIEIECFDGTHKFILNWAIPLFGTNGLIEGAVSVNQDITRRKQAEDALRQALADKDMLMRELQHRVKNSLNMAISLLALEEDNLTDERSRAIFASTRARITSMSAVYEQLYRTGGIDQIDLLPYIHNLCAGLSESYLSASNSVNIDPRLENIQLDVKRALPLGIILNELVTNALKYAFPTPKKQGIIRVELARANEEVHLTVADNGVGLPEGQPHSGGLGLELVRMLSRQIGGSFALENAQGCTARVRFRAEPGPAPR